MGNMLNKHNYTFDTCVGIKICENANVGNLLSCRINFESSIIHISSQTILEANRLGCDVDAVTKQIKDSLGAKVVFGNVTSQMIQDAKYLETKCPTLHDGDSEILAYARATGTTLITCDKIGLGKSKMQKIVDKAIRKPSEVKQKVKSLVLKPGQKIVWRSFQ